MDCDTLRRALVQRLESLARSGVRELPRLPDRPHPPQRRRLEGQHSASQDPRGTDRETRLALDAAKTTVSPPHVAQAPNPSMTVSDQDRVAALQTLACEVASCTTCQELAQSRRQTVFGVGNPNARLLFFGEAPGADEDRIGEPFVGRAGQLLTKIIEACTLRREDVYIMNVLKCRPPGNRNPTSEEAANCRPFFERQLEIIQPEYIVCLGSIAATTLLDTNTSIGRLRGQFHDYRGIPVLATYHPAYLLRNPSAKKLVWEDMKMLMKAMGLQLPTKN